MSEYRLPPVQGVDRYCGRPFFSFRRSLTESVGEVFGLEFQLGFLYRLSECAQREGYGKYVVATVGADRVCVVMPDDLLFELFAALAAGDLDAIRRFVHGDSCAVTVDAVA